MRRARLLDEAGERAASRHELLYKVLVLVAFLIGFWVTYALLMLVFAASLTTTLQLSMLGGMTGTLVYVLGPGIHNVRPVMEAIRQDALLQTRIGPAFTQAVRDGVLTVEQAKAATSHDLQSVEGAVALAEGSPIEWVLEYEESQGLSPY